MNRALIAAVALICISGLTGCAFLNGPPGLYGSPGRTVPTGPSTCGMCGPGPGRPSGPSGSSGSSGSIALRGGGALTDNANDSYVAWGTFLVSGTESTVAIPVPFGGTLSNLSVRVATAPGTGASWTLTVDKNESPTALTCSVTGAATSCNDYSRVAVGVGDKLDLGVTPFGTPELATITWSVTITPQLRSVAD